MNKFNVEFTDTFGGEPNFCWVKRSSITVPEWHHFAGNSGNGTVEPKSYQRTVMRNAKASVGLSNVRGVTESCGDGYTFKPYGQCTILFVNYAE